MMPAPQMPNARRPTLRTVLRRAHMGMAVLAVAMAGISLTLVGLWAIRVNAEHNLQLIARTVGYTVEAAVVFGDRDAVAESVALIGTAEGLAELEVSSTRLASMATWRRLPARSAVGRLAARVGRIALPLQVSMPIVRDGREIGVVRLRGDGEGLVFFLAGGLAVMAACLVLSAAIALVLSRRMLRGLIKPIRALMEVARVVRHDRAFGRRVPPAPIAELNELCEDFNSLLDELEMRHGDLERQNESLAHQANHDSLTGLPNRALFERRLDRAVQLAAESGQQLAVLFFDNDHFKQVNDSHGHAGGDALLSAVATRVRAQLRENDLVARLGGDEFAVLLAPLRGVRDALHIADKIIAGMAVPLELPDGSTIHPSVSVGVAMFPRHAHDSASLLAMADQAMYRAKAVRRGSRQVAGHNDDMDEASYRRPRKEDPIESRF